MHSSDRQGSAALVQCMECGDCHKKDMPGFLNRSSGGQRHISLDRQGNAICEWCTMSAAGVNNLDFASLADLDSKLLQGACSTCRIKTRKGTLWTAHVTNLLKGSTSTTTSPSSSSNYYDNLHATAAAGLSSAAQETALSAAREKALSDARVRLSQNQIARMERSMDLLGNIGTNTHTTYKWTHNSNFDF